MTDPFAAIATPKVGFTGSTLDRADALRRDAAALIALRSRPDARWRRRPEALADLVALQGDLLARALGLTRPGGRVIYSTCTLLAAENEDIVRASGASVADLGSRFPDWAHPRLGGALETLPGRDGTDGFFVARLER